MSAYPGQSYFWAHNADIKRAEQNFLRNKLVDEARSFLGTPYVREGRLKHIGVNCGTFLLCVLQNCGYVSDEDLSDCVGDFWNHGDSERYLRKVARHARKILESVCYASTRTDPGNIIVTKVENTQRFNHGAVVTKWPFGIHAVAPRVCEINLSLDPLWSCRPIEIFDPLEGPE